MAELKLHKSIIIQNLIVLVASVFLLFSTPVITLSDDFLPGIHLLLTDQQPDVPTGAPTNLQAIEINATSITLTWTDNSNSETEFLVVEQINVNDWIPRDRLGPGTTRCTLSVQPNRTYTLAVWAIIGNSNAKSDSITVNTPDLTNLTLFPLFDGYVYTYSENPNSGNELANYTSAVLSGIIWDNCSLFSYADYRGIYYFPIISTAKKISKATLYLYVKTLPLESARQNMAIIVDVISGPIYFNSLTYNNYPGERNYEIPVTIPSTTLNPIVIDLTEVVQNWTDGTWGNSGLIIGESNVVNACRDASVQLISFESMEDYSNPGRRPRLVIEYVQ